MFLVKKLKKKKKKKNGGQNGGGRKGICGGPVATGCGHICSKLEDTMLSPQVLMKITIKYTKEQKTVSPVFHIKI